MSNTSSTSYVVFPWLWAFVILKLAKVATFAAWSWWWLLLPIVPVVVEFFTAITK